MPSAKTLPDPRAYRRQSGSRLVDAALAIAALPPATQQTRLADLRDLIAEFLGRDDEHSVLAALAAPGNRAAGVLLADALDQALLPPPGIGLCLRLFALPVLIVAGAAAPATVPCALADAGELTALFEKAGALGPARAFALSNALTSLDALEAVPLVQLYRASRAQDAAFAAPDLPPADIAIARGDETVHLRFLGGAMLGTADAPGFVETAADIGRWGLPFTRALAAQLGREGLSLLPIPRPPLPLRRAGRAGRFAASELGFQLFLSNVLRRARSRSGDPEVTVSSHADATVRVRITSVFDDLLDQTFGWRLAPFDDLDAVSASILDLLAECHLDRVEIIDTVQEDARPN